MRTTHTYVTMHVSRETYDEVTARLMDVDYDHCILDEGITLEGVMLIHDEEKQKDEDLKRQVKQNIEACKENGQWHGQTEKLSDEALAEDMIEKSDMPVDDVEKIASVIKAVRREMIA